MHSARQRLEYESRIRELKGHREELEKEIHSRNELITRAEHDSNRRNATIERKQTIIDQYNKKLEQIVMASGVSIYRFHPHAASLYSGCIFVD